MICLVVRCSGERTESECIRHAEAQSQGLGRVYTVRERPFSRALFRAMEIAIQDGSPFSIFLDGDILLRPSAVAAMAQVLEEERINFFKVAFPILDRSFGGPTYGVHCYKTSLFHKALQFKELSESDQRPETRMCKEMARAGYPTVLRREIVGLHDYEQFGRDLFRKMFVRSVKFNRHLDFMLVQCARNGLQDLESRAMLAGLIEGLKFRMSGGKTASLDAAYYEELAARVFHEWGLQEKAPMGKVEGEWIEREITEHVCNEVYRANEAWLGPRRGVQWYGLRRPLWVRLRRGAGHLVAGIAQGWRTVIDRPSWE